MIFTLKQEMRLAKRAVSIAMLVVLSACTAGHNGSPYLPSRDGIEAGENVTVQGNENIYTIAHEHNVSMRELIVLNNLKPPFEVRPGQTLTLPAGGTSFAGGMPAPAAAPLAPVEQAPVEPAGVSSQELAPIAAPPSPPSPAPTPPQSLQQPSTAPQSLLMQQPITQPIPVPVATMQAEPVAALNHPLPPTKQVATTMGTAGATAVPAATAAAGAGAINMIWPVQGPILSGYGAKGAGLSNDGVNIGAPKGAPVVASAAGTVVYAGNEMKGFGNLVLIRHQKDWVTAYAHLDRVLVRKDQVVDQGDMIGTVGKTGNVPTPQLHFETRMGDKAVDPAGVVKGSL
jgi:murein DD-endopeptidase MepM/ murein hydrolase activator NlpD